MKRLTAFLLVLALLVCLCSCGIGKNRGTDQASFYYCRIDYAYGTEDGIITREQRDITGHAGDLHYLISLYLMGPLDEELASPFPAGTRLLSAKIEEDVLSIQLSGMGKSFTEIQFTLACACLTMTCLELAGVSQVCITGEDRSITMNRDDLLLYDDITPNETTATEVTAP